MRTHAVLVISDLHIPFQHADSLAFIKNLLKEIKPTDVVFIGDIVDFHAMSRWESDPDGLSAGDELNNSIKVLKKLYRLVPKAKICLGNHDIRAYRRAFSAGISKYCLKDLRDMLLAPKTWEFSEHFVIDGVRYEHGDAAGERANGINAMKDLPLKNMASTVFGHYHINAGIMYGANPKMLYFGMNVGCLIDHTKYAFAYGKAWKHKPILSCGAVIEGNPIVLPMLLNKKGEWIK